MSGPFPSSVLAKVPGFAAAWAAFTLLLALATRPMGLGPGFSNLCPYALAAILLSGAGHIVRAWLRQAALPKREANAGFLRGLAGAGLDGGRLFFLGTAAFNNFVFLSIAYLLGIGLTSLFMRGGSRKKPASAAPASASQWLDLPAAPGEEDAYYRPY
jgi:hypothetical protein